MRTQEGRERGRGSQEWFPELEVPVGMLSWTQRQGDDSAGTKGERCPWDGQKAAVIPSQLLGNCKGRGVKMQQTPAEGWWPGPSRCEGGSRCGWLWEGSRIGGGQPPRVGAPTFLPSSVGGQVPRRGWGPPRLPRAGFSLWTLRPLASRRSSEPPPETSGRWEGAGPPRSKEGGRKNLRQPPPGSGRGE